MGLTILSKDKIAILTFKENNNYGAFLQAFSLQHVLEERGFDVEVIDYVRKLTIENSKLLKFWPKYSFKTMVSSIISYRRNLILDRKGNEVHDKLNLTKKKYYSNEELRFDQENWDNFVVGSDQVWNYVNSNFDPAFFLDFVENNSKKNSYAASFGSGKIPNEFPKKIENKNNDKNFKEAYKNYLSSFSNISVREKSGKNIIDGLLEKDVKVVLDPTLLITKEEWEVIVDHKPSDDKYILVYSIDNKKQMFAQAKKLSKELNLPIKQVFATPKSKLYGVKNVNANPFEWIQVFNNASYVITDSFHGTAFSINLAKPFKVFYHEGKNTYSRIDNLLEIVGLENQKMTNNSDVSKIEDIDYTSVRKKLDEERKKSYAFIDSSLK